MKGKAIGKYAAIVLMGIGLLYLAFKDMDPAKMWEDMIHANLWLIGFSILLGYLAIVLRSYRWRIVLRSMGHEVPLGAALHSVALAYLVNLAIPRGGEIARCTAIQRAAGVPMDKALGTVIMERMIDLLMSLVLVVITVFLALREFKGLFALTKGVSPEAAATAESSGFPWVGVGLAALVLGGLLLLLALYKGVIRHPLADRMRHFMIGIGHGLRSIRSLDNSWAFWGHSIGIWGCYFLMVYICFFSMEATSIVTIPQALFVMMSATFSYILPVPGGIGAYHYLVSSALLVIGVPLDAGLAFATVVHSAQTLMMILAGVSGFAGLAFIRRKHG